MLNYQVHTHGKNSPWVVFLHGAGGSLKTWTYQIGAFEDHFNILLIDLRDHGMSKDVVPSRERYSFSLISEDIKTVLDKVGVEKAHFLTLSFGSVLVQDFIMRYPEKVERLVIAGGIFKGNIFIKSFVQLARFMNVFLKYHTMYSLFSYLLMPRKRNQKARRIYQMQAAKLTHEEYLKWIGLYKEFFRLLGNFFNQQLPVKTLIVMGGEDYIFLKAAKEFAKRQRNARINVVPYTGHIVNIEAPEQFNHLAVSFLKRVKNEYNTPQESASPVPLYQ
ncbi:MAG: alpha/beta hydrolase [Bacteroidota bacterium]